LCGHFLLAVAWQCGFSWLWQTTYCHNQRKSRICLSVTYLICSSQPHNIFCLSALFSLLNLILIQLNIFAFFVSTLSLFTSTSCAFDVMYTHANTPSTESPWRSSRNELRI
jgi:hypothetical protein